LMEKVAVEFRALQTKLTSAKSDVDRFEVIIFKNVPFIYF